MKKTVFKDPAAYSVAMSKDTGCIVMVRTNGQSVTVMGALDRAQSVKFADGLLQWMPEGLKGEPDDAQDAETLN
jgi:hypothetical protein